MVRCFIGLGSNLNNPVAQIRTAITALQNLTDSRLIKMSHFYWSKAVGPEGQDDYLNGTAELTTSLSADALLDELHRIENIQGRERKERWGSRTLDLDLLIYGQHRINTQRLTVPHPELLNRDFVIRPLLDIDPDFTLPDGTRLASRLDYCPSNNLRRCAEVFKL